VNKDDFRTLFLINVGRSLERAGTIVGAVLPSEFEIELHGGGVSGKITSLNDAINIMYLGERSFYGVIDIGVKSIVRGKPVVFVRISDHRPSSFENTWNTPKGNGPFKVIEPIRIEVIE